MRYSGGNMKKAKWIWRSKEIHLNEYVEFLKVLPYTQGKVRIKISVDTEYALFVNGTFVNSGQYADFPWYKIHDEIEITEYLKSGNNEITIIGWYMGDVNYCHYTNHPGLKFEINIDGKIAEYSSEETLCRQYPFLLSGEEVKKINNQLGRSFVWQAKEAEAYHPAVVVDGMPECTTARPIKNLVLLDKLPAEKIGNAVYDLGAETVGYPYIEIRAKNGERVNIAFGEWISYEGHVNRHVSYYDFSFEVEGSGEWDRYFNPLRKLGCRYFEISGECEVREIGVYPVKYPFEEREVTFTEPLRKRIYDVSVKTLLLNAFDHYYDCPWREQAFWTFDARFQMRYGYAAFYGYAYQRAALKLLSEDRREDGLITMVVPSSATRTIPSFTLSYILAMAEYTETSGDKTLAEEYFAKTESVMDAYISRKQKGIIPCFADLWNFYEWKPRYSGNSVKNEDAVLNLLACYALVKMISVCKILEKNEEAEYYSAKLTEITYAVRKKFYNEERGLFRSFEGEEEYSQLVNSLAILCGAAKGEDAERICETLTEENSGLTETTLSMTAFKYDALLKADREKYADFVLRHIDNTFEKMLDAGATSFWETVLGKDDMNGSGSLCHGWSALPVYYYTILSEHSGVRYTAERD